MNLTKLFIENILYPQMEKRKGNKIRQYTKEFIENEKKNVREIERIQQDKLRKLLKHCIENVPAYKNLRINAADVEINPIHALSKVPVLTKDILRKNGNQYLSNNADPKALIPNISGGSTGEAVRFFMDRPTVEHFEAARWRGLSWYGITYGSRCVMLWGNPIELNQASQKKYRMKERYLKNRIIIPAYELSPAKMSEYIKTINKFNPEYIYGYSSSLEAFAAMMIQGNLKLKTKLKAVVSTAETLTDEQRRIIEQGFNCVCVNEYGARDGGILAYECPNHGLHISMENVFLEILNPKTLEPVEDGEPGLAVITDLNNFAMPRLRYVIGDIVCAGKSSCKCLRPLKILSSVQGREEALLLHTNGALVHGHSISHLARKRSIVGYQFVQDSPSSATLYVERGRNPRNFVNEFRLDISAFLGNLDVQIKEVDKIQPSKSGKYRYTIRNFPLN